MKRNQSSFAFIVLFCIEHDEELAKICVSKNITSFGFLHHNNGILAMNMCVVFGVSNIPINNLSDVFCYL